MFRSLLSHPLLTFFLSFLLISARLSSGESISFDPTRGIVEAKVVINGNIIGSFGIDTGADRLYVDREFVRKNRLPHHEGVQRKVAGIEGESEAGIVGISSFEFAGNTLHDLVGTVIDIGRMVKDKRHGYPDGLIGYDILQRCYITVDYTDRSLELSMEEPVLLKEEMLDFISFDIRRHFILVEATLNDSVPARLILDYCASITTLTPSILEDLNIEPDGQGGCRVATLSLDDKLSSENLYVFQNDLGPLKDRISGLNVDGILGANFLFRHKITVDYKRDRLYVHF